MLEGLRRFGLSQHDLPAQLQLVGGLLRLVTLNIDGRHQQRMPAFFYLLTLASVGSCVHGYLVSPLWFIFCRPGSALVEKIIHFSLCMSILIGITKYTSMYWQREELQEIVRAYLLFDSQVVPHSRMAWNIKRRLKDVKKRALAIWFLVMSNLTVYFVVPLATPGRHLTDEHQVMWGLEPMTESPNYEMSFMIVVTCAFVGVYAPVVIAMLLIVLVGYTEAHVAALGRELEHLWDDARDDLRQREPELATRIETNKAALLNQYATRRLETIIEAHAVNKTLIKRVDRVFRNPIAFSFIFLSIALVADLLGGLENTYMQIPFAMVLVATDCITGQRLLDANARFEAAVYGSGWERLDARGQRLVLLLLRSAQQTMRLSAGGVPSLGHAALGAIIKSVYSAHAALHSTITKA